MNTSKTVPLYLAMLVFHVAHVFEETWAHFWPMDAVYGEGLFLLLNWVLFVIPVTFFYFLLQKKRWAHLLSMVYAAIMIVNGIGHNVATIVTGRYFGGFAGGMTGLALIVIGLPMLYGLWKELPRPVDKQGAAV